ncbi:helix-turn-helix domain-containing protein [Paenibacillus tritici]|uniref:AraC family transcriptional regulator n=1 Tax=Paenibacillus tritici TaxID=1873425 RepID=UPI001BA7205A|nr:AraC family transcriptional regulator [Paenibacillus tritici]QUL57174.1 helix-turn-helix domain-containing protein [Paenibacillus tritici]
MDENTNYIFTPIPEEMICFHRTTTTELLNPAMPYHHHDAYEIYLFLRGNAYMYLEQSCYKLAPGDMFIISPSEMHRCVCTDNQMYERIGLNIKRSTLQRLSSPRSNLLSCFDGHPFGQDNLTRLSRDQCAFYSRLADQLIASLHSEAYGQDLLAEAYATRLLVFINTLYQSSTSPSDNLMPELVRQTMTYIEEHLLESISSAQLEQEFHYSGKYISQLFREHTGLTIRSYIVGKRISLSMSHLTAGKSVAEACELSGFSDYANFIRSFKKIVGMPPGKYKASEQP